MLIKGYIESTFLGASYISNDASDKDTYWQISRGQDGRIEGLEATLWEWEFFFDIPKKKYRFHIQIWVTFLFPLLLVLTFLVAVTGLKFECGR